MISLQRILAGRDHPGRAPHQRPRRLDLGLHVGEHVRDRLEGADRAAELLALLGVVHGEVDDAARAAAVAGGGDDALDLQAGEHDVPALVLAADQAVGRHADVVEEDLVGADAAPAEHVELAHLEPGRVVVDQEQRHPLAVMRLGSVFT